MGEPVDALSSIVAGPVLEAVLHACPPSSFAAVRGASLQTRLVADQLNQMSPRWPLRLLIRSDHFVRRHEEMPPEFVLHFNVGSCRAFASSMGSKGNQDEEIHLPRDLAEEFIRKLGSMHRTYGEACTLWTLPKLRRRATLRQEMTVQEYQWSSMQVAMQCDPRASREMLLEDARRQVVLRHVFLDQDYVLPNPAIKTGATRTRHPVLDTFGDASHRWVLRQLRKLRDAQRGSPAIVDDCYNACSLGIIDPAVLIPFEAEDEDDIFQISAKHEASCVAIRGPFGETIKTGEWDTRVLEFQTAHGPLSLASGSTHGWYFPNRLGLAWLRIIYVASKIRHHSEKHVSFQPFRMVWDPHVQRARLDIRVSIAVQPSR